MKKLALAVAASTTIFAAPALAADLRVPVKAPMTYAPAPFNWTGCYIGVQGGGAWGRSRHINQTGGVNFNITDSYDVDGFLVGPTVGCNFQTGGFVFGIEGDWSWSSKEGGGNGLLPFFNPLAVSQTREHWLATVRGRVGWAFDRWMIYATGGGAFADVEARVVPDPASGLAIISESRTRAGWTVGGGLEWAFAPNWSAKVEYLHVAFENEGYFLTPPAGFGNRAGGVPLHNDIIRAGINYRFGWGGPVVASY
jgi:outer membrane immunogenic protein